MIGGCNLDVDPIPDNSFSLGLYQLIGLANGQSVPRAGVIAPPRCLSRPIPMARTGGW